MPTDREKRTREYLARKPYPGRLKTGTYNPSKDWDYGLKPEMTIKSGWCPCSVCGHEFMWECEDENCACCSSACC